MNRKYHIDYSINEEEYNAWLLRLQKELNKSQYNFVTSNSRAIMGLAGPGSGKTRALIHRTAHLIKSGVPPGNILLVTFTNKAAEVMKMRLKHLLGYYPQDLWGGTFHSIGARILRAHPHFFERNSHFTILDEDDRSVIMKKGFDEIKKGLSAEEQKLFVKRGFAGKAISQARNSGKGLAEIIDIYYPRLQEYTELLQRVAEDYEQRKKEINAFDFDDLLIKWLELFKNNGEIRDIYQQKFHHVLVDEFQDTNVIQGNIIDVMVEETNVCVVGDDAQSIYAFRFADIANIVQFPKRHPDCEIIRMEENYRSCPEIVDMINEIISLNENQLPKKLTSLKPSSEKPWVVKAKDVTEEAAFVTQRIQELYQQGLRLKDIAVLYRSSYLTQDLEMEILKRRIPYRTFGGLKFMQKAHIKDMLAWMRILYNPHDESSWRRVVPLHPGLGKSATDQVISQIIAFPSPLEGIVSGKITPSRGKKGWETIKQTVAAIMNLNQITEIIYHILENGYYELLSQNFPDSWEERYRSLERLASYSQKYEDLETFLEALSLEETLFFEDEMGAQGENDYLTLSTIHSAKGKEWEAVFVLAVNEGHFPSGWGNVNLEEERRLFYVAASRAARYLHLLTYTNDYRQGSSFVTRPSLFLRELPPEKYELVYLE